ncbi:MAG TPA: Ig-like domain-containing protein, partial [Arenibacter sp.]|nr:Ig-like domain-containing protein [Arenibacter sp.]
MKLHPSNLVKATLLGFVLTLSISCNKDSDLLAEYVVENPKNILLNDIVIGTLANQPIIIDPIDQETYKEPDKVIITEVTPPKMGNTVINGDNTITYTPDTDKTGTDEFDYTTNITNPDKSVTTETGKVTVTVTDKTPTTKPTDMGEL